MTRRLSWTLLAAATGLLAFTPFSALVAANPGSHRLLSIDDLLSAEALGHAQFSPDGRKLVFAREAATTASPSRGMELPSFARQTVIVADRSTGAMQEAPAKPGTYYSIVSGRLWQPKSEGVLLFAVSDGVCSFAYWDISKNRIMHLPGQPDCYFPVYAWTAHTQLVYAVGADTAVQGTSHGQLLDQLGRNWWATWNGQEGRATVSSANPVFKATLPSGGELRIADPARGVVEKLADGEYVGVFPSPDGRHVAAIRRAETMASSLHISGFRSELQIFDAGAPVRTPPRVFEDLDIAYSNLGRLYGAAWASHAHSLLVAGHLTNESSIDPRLFEIDVNTAARRELPISNGSLTDPALDGLNGVLQFGWIGGKPAAVIARSGDGKRSYFSVGTRLDYGERGELHLEVRSWNDRHDTPLTNFANESVSGFLPLDAAGSALVIADGAVWEIAPNRPPRRVSKDTSARIVDFAENSNGDSAPISAYFDDGQKGRLAILAFQSGEVKHCVLDMGTGRVGPQRSATEILAVAPDLRAFATMRHDGMAVRLALEDRKVRTLLSLNQSMQDRAAGSVERFTFQSAGDELAGWIVRPPGAAARQPLPAVVIVYGGTVYGRETPVYATLAEGASVDSFPILNGQLLAAQGYAVIYPSTPLAAGSEKDLMAMLADHVVAAIDALAKSGAVDPNRVAVMGQSFGGFSTAAILARRSDRFKAGIALAGIYDWMYSYGNKALAKLLLDDGADRLIEMKFIEGGQIRLGKPFWQAPEAYMRNSPIFSVDRMDAPLLIIQSDLDIGATSLSGADRMYHALLRAGKKPVLVRYWGEGHVASSAWVLKDQWSRILTWLESYLHEP